MTALPKCLRTELEKQILAVRTIWERDREAGLAGVYLPGALARKYRQAAKTFGGHWLFPASQSSLDPRSGLIRRHYLHAKVYGQAIKRAAESAGIPKRVTNMPRARWD